MKPTSRFSRRFITAVFLEKIFSLMNENRKFEEDVDMLHKKLIFVALAFALVVGVVAGALAKSLFPEWASENGMVVAITIGAIAGAAYPLLVRKRNSN